jgi:dihydroneopterin aldolase
MDLITIEGLRLRCVFGYKDEEPRDRSGVIVDLTIRG